MLGALPALVLTFRVFFLSIYYQAKLKFAALAAAKVEAKASGKSVKDSYNRYSDQKILAGDRAVGNFLEWQGVFLILFWLNAALNGSFVWVGWVFVAARLFYLLLAPSAIQPSGIKVYLLAATAPAYCVLVFYLYRVVMAVL